MCVFSSSCEILSSSVRQTNVAMEERKKQGVCCSQELLSCGNRDAIHEKLLLKPKVPSGLTSLQTSRVPRSSVLDRLQDFLPKMAQANENLKNQMGSTPAGHFDIENTADSEKVIEMDVALVELSDTDSDRESSEDNSEDSSDSDISDKEDEESTIKLPGQSKSKMRANIEVLEKE